MFPVDDGINRLVLLHCLLVPVGQVFWSDNRSDEMFSRLRPFCCYCSVRCSLVSPCLEGWLGDGAWEGCVPEGRVWAMGTPPGTMPSNAPGMPPGATPTTPGGYLRKKQDDHGGDKGNVLLLLALFCHSNSSYHGSCIHTVRITNPVCAALYTI